MDTATVPAPKLNRYGKPMRQCRPPITLQDVDAIADLVAEKMTETEACAALDLNYTTWANWKCRHADNFGEALTRVRAKKIQATLNSVKRKQDEDWRAAAWLAKSWWPERYGDRLTVAVKGIIQVGTVESMRPGLPAPKQAQVVDIAEVQVQNKGV